MAKFKYSTTLTVISGRSKKPFLILKQDIDGITKILHCSEGDDLRKEIQETIDYGLIYWEDYDGLGGIQYHILSNDKLFLMRCGEDMFRQFGFTYTISR